MPTSRRSSCNGADWFASHGHREDRKGTKVFALGGKINNTGLVEIPMGTTLRDDHRRNRRRHPERQKVQSRADRRPFRRLHPGVHSSIRPIDYDNLIAIGSMMGSGGLIVMDEDDLHGRYREVLPRVHGRRILRQVHPVPYRHEAPAGDPQQDHQAARARWKTSISSKSCATTSRRTRLCGLGQTAPNPVLSTLQVTSVTSTLRTSSRSAARPASARHLLELSSSMRTSARAARSAHATARSALSPAPSAKPHCHRYAEVHQVRRLHVRSASSAPSRRSKEGV